MGRPGRPPIPLVLAAVLALAAGSAAAAAAGLRGGPDASTRREEKREAREALRAGDYDAPTIGWREGPVRYLLTRDEDVAYRSLGTRDERARFIQRFWAGRDPDPSSPDNEFRSLFYDRVRAADRLFTAESTKPGWKTDRGKIYILLGPPDDLDEASLRQQQAQLITWTYRDPPPGTVASPNSQIRFLRDASGEYRLTSGVRLFSGDTSMSLALSTQALQMSRLPATHEVLDLPEAPAGGGAPTGEVTPAGDFRLHADVFRAGNGLALVVLTVWVRQDLLAPAGEPAPAGAGPGQGAPGAGAPGGPGPVAPGIAARLVKEGPDPRVYDMVADTGLHPGQGDLGRGPDGTRVFQGGIIVEPGTYSVRGGLFPSVSGAPAFRDTLVVPLAGDAALALGPITLADHFERLPTAASEEYAAPFILGRLRAVPRLDDLFDVGDELAFYFQVTGASNDPIEGRPDLDVEYRIEVLAPEPDGATGYQPFGHPIRLTGLQSPLQGFALPIDGWAPGAYRLEVTVTDNVSGASARGETGFRVR